MSPDRWEQIRTLFEAAAARPAEARSAYLDEACGGDAALRETVAAMLAADADVPSVLQATPRELAALLPPDLAAEAASAAGRIGPYRLIRTLGRGGMGTVYLAERDDDQYRKQVALKLVRPGLDSEEILHRFRYERQILAALEHPGIARLLDGGVSSDGRPFLVMEYVDGQPIDQYCDANRLTVAQRLPLFGQVCAAVQYAHQNLVVHRDLKPSNILVTADGTVKLLDFGIAKLLDEEATPWTAPHTRTGFRVLTPQYASPEQLQGESLTTASDVFSLGVILYELLTGRRPGETLKKPSTVVLQAILRTRQDGTTETVSPDEVGQARRTTGPRLQRRLAGDLDTILLMALRREPERRYTSAEALREDLRRHLSGLPVSAQPDTLGYRARKFVRRHRAGVAATAAFLVLLAAAAVALVLQQAQTARERDLARQERARAEAVASFLEGLFAASDPFAAERLDTLRAADLLARGVARLDTALADQPDARAGLLAVMGRVYLNLGRYTEARPLLEEAVAVHAAQPGEAHPEQAQRLTTLGHAYEYLGDFDRAQALLAEALALNEARYGPAHAEVAASLNNLGLLAGNQGDYETSERHLRRAVALLENRPDQHERLATALSSLATALQRLNRYDAADTLFQRAVALQRSLYGGDHPNLAVGLNNLGLLLSRKGEHQRAEAALREALAINEEALGPTHPNVASTLSTLGSILRNQGDYDAARPVFQRSLDLKRQVYGEAHPQVVVTMNNFATLLREQGDHDAAEAMGRDAVAMARRVYDEDHPGVAITTGNLAGIIHDRGDHARAAPLYEAALDHLARAFPPGHIRILLIQSNYGDCLAQLGRYAEAEALLVPAYEGLLQNQALDDAFIRDAAANLVKLYEAWGRPEAADGYRRAADAAP